MAINKEKVYTTITTVYAMRVNMWKERSKELFIIITIQLLTKGNFIMICLMEKGRSMMLKGIKIKSFGAKVLIQHCYDILLYLKSITL